MFLMHSLQFSQIRSLEAIHKQFEEFPGAFMKALHVSPTNRLRFFPLYLRNSFILCISLYFNIFLSSFRL